MGRQVLKATEPKDNATMETKHVLHVTVVLAAGLFAGTVLIGRTVRSQLDEIKRMVTVQVESLGKDPLSNGYAQASCPPALAELLAGSLVEDGFDEWDRPRLDQLREKLISEVNGLPVAHRADLAEQIARANWLLDALDLKLTPPATSTKETLALFVTANSLLMSSPRRPDSGLDRDVASRAERLVTTLDGYLSRIMAIVEKEGEHPTREATSEALVVANVLVEAFRERDMVSAGLNLEDPERDYGRDAEIFELYLRIFEWMDEAESINLSDHRINEFDDPKLVNVMGVAQDGEVLRSLCIDLGVSPLVALQNDLKRLSRETEHCVEDLQRRIHAEYQTWALTNIRVVMDLGGGKASVAISNALSRAKADPAAAARDKDIRSVLEDNPVFRHKIGELSGIRDYREQWPRKIDPDLLYNTAKALSQVTGWKGQDVLARSLNQDLLEQRLLVIDENLLDRPVAKLYAEAFDLCWNYLEGSGERISVARSSGLIEKRKLKTRL